MFGFLSQIPSLFGKGLATVGGGIASGAKTLGRGVGKLPQRMGMGEDPTGMMRTPDFVSTGGRAMPDFKPPVSALEPLAPKPDMAAWNPMRAPSAGPSAMPDALPTRNIGARDTLTNIARAENPPLEQAPQYRDPIRQARDEFVNERLQGGRSRWKQIAIPALLGAAAQGGSGDPWRMLGGAIGGAGMGTFAPKQALEGEYEMRQGGRDREELGREQEWQKAQGTLENMRRQRANEEARIRQQADIERQKIEYEQGRAAIKDKLDAERERRANEKHQYDLNKPYFAPPREGAAPFASSPLGIYDKRSGQVTTPMPPKAEREQGPPSGATQAAASIDKMRREAMQKWDIAKALPDSDPEKAESMAAARSALAQFNEAVKQLGENYGDYYETGNGKQGWGYYKPRKRQQSAAPAGGGSMGAAAGGRRNVNDLLKYLQ